MIQLEPIPLLIQQRLFEKMRVLSNHKTSPGRVKNSSNNNLTFDKMATRTSFLRMTSGQLNPVILMGGKIKDDGTLPVGYNEIYGPRTYNVPDTKLKDYASDLYNAGDFSVYSESQLDTIIERGMTKDSSRRTLNKLKRPTPGLKSADISFKGGVRALREATVQWTCWDWDELDLLMPHFLSHGKTVMLEWGWIYDKGSLLDLSKFIEEDSVGNKFISADAFDNYKNIVLESKGDMDLMVGIIKNFEFTTRADGGFDCQTILTSVGASILDNPEPNQAATDPNTKYNISLDDDNEKTLQKLTKATGESGTDADERGDKNSLIKLNSTVTLKSFIKNIDRYIAQNAINNGELVGNIAYIANKYLLQASKINTNLETFKGTKRMGGIIGERKDIQKSDELTERSDTKFWVRWGWFEDNVLSKFLSVTSNPNTRLSHSGKIVTAFRSVEKVEINGRETGNYQSVQIKNHPNLETVNINHYILPGQFNPVQERIFEYEGKPYDLKGDEKYIRKLASTINGNFYPFSTSVKTKIGTRDVFSDTITAQNIMEKTKPSSGFDDTFSPGERKREKIGTEDVFKSLPGETGNLRNMLVNTKILKQAFGVDTELTAEPINVVEAIETVFTLLNQELNFWNYQLVVDSKETFRAKIIDNQVTSIDLNKKPSQLRTQEQNNELFTEDSREPGVFYFPVWQTNSIVKSQNVTAKVPNAMALSTMYGGNMDQLQDFLNPGSSFATKEGVALAGLYNSQDDVHLGKLNIALLNNHQDIGVRHEVGIDDANSRITLEGGKEDKVFDYILNNSKKIEEVYEDKLKKIKDGMRDSEVELALEEYDDSIPPPFVNNLTNGEIASILEHDLYSGNKSVVMLDRLQSIYDEEGRLKTEYIQSVSYLTTQYGQSRTAETPLLIPLDLELEIDGIGGIYPGNSFHSSYLPVKYQDNTVFQAFDVNHKVDSSGWSVTLSGAMRASLKTIFTEIDNFITKNSNQIRNYVNKAKNDLKERQNRAIQALGNVPNL